MKTIEREGKPDLRIRPLWLIAATTIGLLGAFVATHVSLRYFPQPPPPPTPLKPGLSTPWGRANLAAAVFNAAQAAGLDFMALAGDDLSVALDLMAEGGNPEAPPFNTTTFVARSVQGLDPAIRGEVLEYLEFNPDTRELHVLSPKDPQKFPPVSPPQ